MKIFSGGKDAEIEILAIMAGGGEEAIQLIERAGRTAYQSQDKASAKSAGKFVAMLRRLGHESVLEHSAMTVRFRNCSRGMTHELVRHRMASFTQESTRYVDEGELEVVLPPFAPPARDIVMRLPLPGQKEKIELSLADWIGLNETVYRKLRSGDYRLGGEGAEAIKWKPQDARQMLPIGVTAEIVMTANLREWRHVFALRTAKASHWEIRSVMGALLEMVRQRVPVIFDDFKKAGEDGDGVPFYNAANS